MKEKIIEILKNHSYPTLKLTDCIVYGSDFEKVSNEIIKLIKSEIYTDTDYLAESMFNHFK